MTRLEGALNFARAETLFGNLDQLESADRIDLSAVTQCDSAGIALLLELQRRAQRSGKALCFTGAPPALRDLLRFFGIDKMLTLE